VHPSGYETTDSIGGALYAITTESLPVHPDEFRPVTVYDMFAVGLATGLGQLVQLKPLAGTHVYVFAPETLRCTAVPVQTLSDGGFMDKVGRTSGGNLVETVYLQLFESVIMQV